MSVHIETHKVTTGDYAGEVIVTDTGEVLHRVTGKPSLAEARRCAWQWIGRQVLAGAKPKSKTRNQKCQQRSAARPARPGRQLGRDNFPP